MTEQSVETRSDENLGDPFAELACYLTHAEKVLSEAERALGFSADLINTTENILSTVPLPCDREALVLADHPNGELARRLERVKTQRARLIGSSEPDTWISVEQLAHGIGQSVGHTRRLLEAKLIPGARRKTPGVKNSPWLIPPSAAAAYAALHGNGKES